VGAVRRLQRQRVWQRSRRCANGEARRRARAAAGRRAAALISKKFTVELLPTSDKWSILLRGKNHETMLITVNTPTFLAEAAPAATVPPCWQRFDEKRQSGYALALTGRCVR